jgi:chromate transport protein ChrA
MNESAKQAVDAISLGTVVATVAGWLPAVAAIFTIVWTTIRIYESRTVQNLVIRLRGKSG